MTANSSMGLFYPCLFSRAPFFILTSFIITKVLLFLPFSIFIFYLCHQRSRQRRSFKTSHSDIFTIHMTAVELNSFVASAFFFIGFYSDVPVMTKGGFHGLSMTVPGQMLFHILTCVDRYLAVVHPVTYRRLRQSGGVRIRNITIGCVWLLCFGWMGLSVFYTPDLPIIPFLCLLVFSLFAVSFCSLCVLRVLIRPGPGDVGGDEERVDQSKHRAVLTITTILAFLLLWFVGFLVCIALDMSWLLTSNHKCVLITSANWLSLPGSLVLPLLFLHRAGKLPCCCCSDE